MAAKKTKSKKTVAEEVEQENKPAAIVGQPAKLKNDVKVGDETWPAGTEGYLTDVQTKADIEAAEKKKDEPVTATFRLRQNSNTVISVDYEDVEGSPEGYGELTNG